MTEEPYPFSETPTDVRLLFDDPAFSLPGWPGYRNRPGRSGLDPLDYQYEFAHMQGRMIRMLLDRQWPTENGLYKLALILFGLYSLMGFLGLILVWIALGTQASPQFAIGVFVFSAAYGLFLRSLFAWLDQTDAGSEN